MSEDSFLVRAEEWVFEARRYAVLATSFYAVTAFALPAIWHGYNVNGPILVSLTSCISFFCGRERGKDIMRKRWREHDARMAREEARCS